MKVVPTKTIKKDLGTSLAVQWLRHHASNAGGSGSNPGLGTKIPHAMQCGKKKKKQASSGFWPFEGNTSVKTRVDFPKPLTVTGSP